MAKSPRKDVVAVGYVDGSVRLWDSKAGAVIVTFNGHKKAVTALAFDEQGARLASASQDTEIILWDVDGESGMFRYPPLLAEMPMHRLIIWLSQIARSSCASHLSSLRHPSLCNVHVHRLAPWISDINCTGHFSQIMGSHDPTL